jgi:hypothetical protein
MTNRNKIFFSELTSLFLCLGLIIPFGVGDRVGAQSLQDKGSSRNIERLKFNNFFKPSTNKSPKKTIGAATRNNNIGLCPNDNQVEENYLMPLISSSENNVTKKKRPTFFVYIPTTSARQISLTIKDETEDYYYQNSFPITATSEIIGIQLPKEAKELRSDRTYTWSITVVCDKHKQPGDPFVSGEIRQLQSDAIDNSSSDIITLEERINSDAQKGIWYDTLESLAALKKQYPQDSSVNTMWENLLKSVELDSISNRPLTLINQ